MGVLPVPPVAKLPTQISGKLNEADLNIFLSYKKFLTQITNPYNNENGNNKYLKLLSKIKNLKSIKFTGCYTKI